MMSSDGYPKEKTKQVWSAMKLNRRKSTVAHVINMMIAWFSEPLLYLYSEASGREIEPVIYLNHDMAFKVLPDQGWFTTTLDTNLEEKLLFHTNVWHFCTI